MYHAPATAALALSQAPLDVYDELMDRLDANGMGAVRARLAGELSGDVLEVGSGTGHMFRHYGAAARVWAIEPARTFRAASARAAERGKARVRVLGASAQTLPFPDARFDAVVCCCVLCSVPDVPLELTELSRVLKPGAPLLAAEHVRSERPLKGALMDLCNPLWLALNRQGCNLNRRSEEAIRGAGFEVDSVERYQLFSPGLPAFPCKLVLARKKF